MVSAARATLRARRRQYDARRELERQQLAVRQRDQFLAMLGHELRNPLAAILLAAELLDSPRGDARRQREIIVHQGQHLASIVDDLLDVSRVMTGKIVLRRETIELHELVERGTEGLKAAARSRGVSLDLRHAPDPLLVAGDPVRLEQIVSNLLTNAIKYTPAGGHVELRIAAEGDCVVLRVKDSGVGIGPEMLPHVFDLFAQAERTLDRAQGGLGIGLTLVRSLVELHGGKVEARSDGLGQGSEFAVRLPLHRATAAAAARRPEPAVEAGTSYRVLIVEDNGDMRELMQTLVEDFGHHAEVAADGLQGVERALALTPDVVLVDIGLPGLDGYGVARRIRADLGADVLMVALTGYGQPDDQRRAFEAGFDMHYTKPVDPTRLRRLLGTPRSQLPRRSATGSTS